MNTQLENVANRILPRDQRRKMVEYYTPRNLAIKVLNNQGIHVQGVPLRRTNGGRFKYPLQTMERGQYFFVPAIGRSVVQTNNSVTSSIAHVRRKTGRQFFQKRFETGVQVWRIE